MSPIGEAIIRALEEHGDNVPGNIAELIDYHPKSVSRGLNDLAEEGYVRNKGRGVWTVTPSGRKAIESQPNTDE
jgi:Mn-dependent DtxR family transcriptional regulator